MTRENNCEKCGILFSYESKKTKRFCTESCQQKARYERKKSKVVVTRDCNYCTKPYEINASNQRYCSYICQQRAKNKIPFKITYGHYNTRSCKRCGSVFNHRPNNFIYCSNDCNIGQTIPIDRSSDSFGRRWELLWRALPTARPLMLKIENRLPVA